MGAVTRTLIVVVCSMLYSMFTLYWRIAAKGKVVHGFPLKRIASNVTWCEKWDPMFTVKKVSSD